MTRSSVLLKIIRGLDYFFLFQLLGLLLAGSYGAWQQDIPELKLTSIIAGILWLILAVATVTSRENLLGTWRGTLQLITAWLVFPLLKAIRITFIKTLADPHLLLFDRYLWAGKSLPEWMIPWESAFLSELFSLGYFLFFFIVLVPAAVFSVRRRSNEAQYFFIGLTMMYSMGFLGYILVPASGPFIAFPEIFAYPVNGGVITHFLVGLVAQGITGMDVFPSLHAGIGCYVTGFFLLGKYRLISVVLVPIVVVLIGATMYLRYHYGIDVFVGILIAIGVLFFISICRKEFCNAIFFKLK